MPRRAPYGNTPAEHMAFVISLPVRRWALLHAAQHGEVHARDLLREFPEYSDRFGAADVLHVLRDRGFLAPGRRVADVAGLPNQLTYTLTDTARQAIAELHAMTAHLHQSVALCAALSPTEVTADETDE